MKIRDFIYLDSGRMYSLYSQVFEGIAERVTNTYFNRLTTGNDVKKAFTQDLVKSETEETLEEIESKVMYDNLYNQLEERLSTSINIIDSNCSTLDLNKISNSFLFKIVGQAHIFDYFRLVEYTDKFNKLGEIIAESKYGSLSEEDRKKTSAKQIIREDGLSQDRTLLSNLKYIADFFKNGLYEVQIDPGIDGTNIEFTGILKKEYLRIGDERLRHLYGNVPSMKWTMVGQLTYLPKENPVEQTAENVSSEENSSISDSFEKIMRAATELEDVFSQSQIYQKVRLAPIVIYIEKDI